MRALTVSLPADRSYEIRIGAGLLAESGAALATLFSARRVVVFSQPPISNRWGAALLNALAEAGFEATLITYPSGERHKHLRTIARLYERLYNLPGIDRKTVLVALGGGVVGDMVGFVAATYLRGLDWVQIPTTLLAMVDSSVGGKTGVDFQQGKNLIGAFHQPRLVLADTEVLTTLPSREVRSGLAEVVKYGVISEPELLDVLEQPQTPAWQEEIVARSCAIKAEVVGQDEREESGLRAILNFGHTIGHALEAATAYRRYRHGEAVAIGMMSACFIGEEAGATPPEVTLRVRKALKSVALPTSLPADVTDATLVELTARDKKAAAGTARYLLASRLGEVSLRAVPAAQVQAGLGRQRREEL